MYLMCKVVNNEVRNEEKRLSSQQLLEMLGLESIEKMIRKKRLQWIAHCARRGESDLTWRRMRRELQDEQSGWRKQIREEWKKMGVKSVKQWKIEDREWLEAGLGAKRREWGEITEGLMIGGATQRKVAAAMD